MIRLLKAKRNLVGVAEKDLWTKVRSFGQGVISIVVLALLGSLGEATAAAPQVAADQPATCLRNPFYYPLYFERDGERDTSSGDNGQEAIFKCIAQVRKQGIQLNDVFIFSHGWWQDPDKAGASYRVFIEGMIKARKESKLPEPTRLLIGVHWPSAYWSDAETSAPKEASEIRKRLDTIAGREMAEKFVKDILPAQKKTFPESTERTVMEKSLELFFEKEQDREKCKAPLPPGESLFSRPVELVAGRNRTGIIERFAEEIQKEGGEGASEYINALSYWRMKKRAACIGVHGLYQFIQALNKQLDNPQVRIHAIGHSFGTAVMSSSIRGPEGSSPNRVHSLILIQGAISRYAFTSKEEIPRLIRKEFSWGSWLWSFWRSEAVETDGPYHLLTKDGLVARPILVTHSPNDIDNKKLYPKAERLGATLFNGKLDYLQELGKGQTKYGALGFHGATLSGTGVENGDSDYTFKNRSEKVINVEFKQGISGHSPEKVSTEPVYRMILKLLDL